MKKVISYTAIILALATANSFAVTNDDGTKSYSSIKSSAGANKSSYDIQFLDTMIAHHRQEIEMAELAATKSQNEEVKNKAQLLVDDQKSDISKMQGIRDDIQEKAPEAINLGLDGMLNSDVKGLNSQTAKNFDEKFLKAMIKHKEGGKQMAKDATRRAKNAKVKQVAGEISSREAGEIAELKDMLSKMD